MCKCCLKLFGAQLPCLELTCCTHGSGCHMKGWQTHSYPRGKVGVEEILSICAKSPGDFQLMWILFDDLLPKYFVLH